jgi:hypothetical protein
MQVQLEDASGLADRFEALLETKGVSIRAHASTGADMLPLWHVLNADSDDGARGFRDIVAH